MVRSELPYLLQEYQSATNESPHLRGVKTHTLVAKPDPFDIVGRTLDTSEGNIYFSRALRCWFQDQWHSYLIVDDGVEISLPNGDTLSIRLAVDIIEGKRMVLL